MLKFPEGRKARYKHKFRVEYYSNQGEQIVMRSGHIRVIIDNEWRSHEEVVVPQALPGRTIPEGVMGIRAEIKKGASAAIFLGEKQTYEQFPFTFDMFNDQGFYLAGDARRRGAEVRAGFSRVSRGAAGFDYGYVPGGDAGVCTGFARGSG